MLTPGNGSSSPCLPWSRKKTLTSSILTKSNSLAPQREFARTPQRVSDSPIPRKLGLVPGEWGPHRHEEGSLEPSVAITEQLILSPSRKAPGQPFSAASPSSLSCQEDGAPTIRAVSPPGHLRGRRY